MTKEQFKAYYYKNSRFSKEDIIEWEKDMTVVKCGCDEIACRGWAMVSKKGLEFEKKT